MSPRLAITAMLAAVALLTVGSGVGLAQTGLDSSTSASDQQYVEKPKSERLGVIGEIETETPEQDTQPAAQPAPAPAAAPAPAPAQSGQLPFTGFAAGAMLLIGALLLAGGLVLRRTTRRTDAA